MTEEVKKEDNVVSMEEVKIKLTNGDVLNFATPDSPANVSFNKIQSLAVVSGKIQYWSFRVWKKMMELHKDIDEVRQGLVKTHAKKDEKGELIIEENNATFTDEGIKAFQEAFVELMSVSNDLPFMRIKVTSQDLEKMNNFAKEPNGCLTLVDMINLDRIFEFVE